MTSECRSCGRRSDAPICGLCLGTLCDELHAVPGVVDDLAVAAAMRDRRGSERVGAAGTDRPLPMRTAVGRRTRALARIIIRWGRRVALANHVTIPIGTRELVQAAADARAKRRDAPARPDGAALTSTPITEAEQIAVWLAVRPQLLRRYDSIAQLHTDLNDAIAAARTIVDLAADRRYLGPCPTQLRAATHEDDGTCRYPLRAERDAGWVRCGRCREQHQIWQIEERAAQRADDELRTLGEIARILRATGLSVHRQRLYEWVDPSCARGWQHRDGGTTRITDHRIGDNDIAVYRVGDIRAVVEAHTAVETRDDKTHDKAAQKPKGKTA